MKYSFINKYLKSEKKLVLLFLILGISFLIIIFVFWGRSNFIARGNEGNVQIKIGIILSPQSIKVSNDSLKGLQIELIGLLPEINGPFLIEPYTSEEVAWDDVKEGKIDMLAIPSLQSLTRDSGVLYTQPIYDTSYVLLRYFPDDKTRSEEEFSLQDLRGESISIPSHSYAMRTIIQHLAQESIPGLQVNELEISQEQLVLKVSDGEINFAMCEKELAKEYMKRLPNIKADVDMSFVLHHGWVLKPSDYNFKQEMDSIIDIAQKNPTWNKTLEKYNMKPIENERR